MACGAAWFVQCMAGRANTRTAPTFGSIADEARPGAPAAMSDPSEEIDTDFPSESENPPTGVPVSVAVGVVIVPVHPPAGCSNTYTLPSPETIPTVADGRADGDRLRVGAQRHRRAERLVCRAGQLSHPRCAELPAAGVGDEHVDGARRSGRGRCRDGCHGRGPLDVHGKRTELALVGQTRVAELRNLDERIDPQGIDGTGGVDVDHGSAVGSRERRAQHAATGVGSGQAGVAEALVAGPVSDRPPWPSARARALPCSPSTSVS